MFRGIALFAVVCAALTAHSQTVEERVRTLGFIIEVDEFEQHQILARDDSSPFYMRLYEKWEDEIPDAVYMYVAGEVGRETIDEALKEMAGVMPDIWALTSRPRYYLAGDWSDWIRLKVPHLSTIRKVMRLHHVLVLMAAEDSKYDDVTRSLVAMRTIADHARDNPGLIGTLTAQSVEAFMHSAIQRAAEQFTEDAKGIRVLREFVDTVPERPQMEGLQMEVPLLIAIIDGLASGEITMSQVSAASAGFELEEIEETDVDKLLPFSEHHSSIRKRYLNIVLQFAEVWGDQSAIEKVQKEVDESLDEEPDDMAVVLPNMVMSMIMLLYSSAHSSEQSARVNTRITKIGLAAMEMRQTNGEWPTLEQAAKLAGVSADDPFGDQIHFVPKADSLLMYSNGRDQVDDGGSRRSQDRETYDSPVRTFKLKK